MADIILRQKAVPLSVGATTKNAPLTLAEVDDNFDKMNADVENVVINSQDFAIAVAIALG